MTQHTQARWLLMATEPYRIFFPVAILMSMIGVALWPLYYGGFISYYPVFEHPRLMIEGFVGGFVLGFLGTALPKMLSVKPFQVYQISMLFALYLSFCTAHILGKWMVGDALFAATMIFFICCVIPRVLASKKLPPPGMVLSALGILSGLGGALWGAFFISSTTSPYLFPFSQRLLYQAFILIPVLGVGSFMFPMILDTERDRDLTTIAWRWKTAEACLIGILIIATYWIETMGYPRAMSWCRFALAAYWLGLESGCFNLKNLKSYLRDGAMANSLRAGNYCVLLALLATGIMVQQKIALDHILYIGGFGLIAMMVATRVIFGHSGQSDQFKKWIKPLVTAVALLLLAMATRVSADFLPNVRNSHHVYAAVCWLVVSIIWGIAILPSVRKTPTQKPSNPLAKKQIVDLMDMNFR